MILWNGRNCTSAIDSGLSHHVFPTEKVPGNQTDLTVRKIFNKPATIVGWKIKIEEESLSK